MRLLLFFLVGGLVFSGCGYYYWSLTKKPEKLTQTELDALYLQPITDLGKPLNVYHLGHSLVGRNIPYIVAQFAGVEHKFNSQLGWGTTLKAHWEPDIEIQGYDVENRHEQFRPAKEALSSGEYDAFVVTEMVEIRSAIKYFDSAKYLNKWARFAKENNPNVRIYLYETWHNIDDPEGWLNRLDADRQKYWENELLAGAFAYNDLSEPIYIIPAGQVMARFARALERRSGLEPLTSHANLFRVSADGTQDTIHLNAYGEYLVALTHYATLYGKSPIGLPNHYMPADTKTKVNIEADIAETMQSIVWEVVRTDKKAGLFKAD